MDASNDTTTTGPTVEDGSNNPHAKNHGRLNNPPWKKVLVYDSDRKKLDVKSEKDINIDRCQKVDLPSNRSQVPIYVDWETETKATTACIGADGRGNMLSAVLYLDELGVHHRMLRRLGLLSTLYVTDPASSSETSSQIVGD